MSSYVYSEQFYGNVLIIGRTRSVKTHFVQKLAANNFFGNLVKTEWISYIKLDKSREAEIQSCFNCDIEFHYPNNKDKFENLLQDFKLHSRSNKISDDTISDSNSYEENIKRDCLIVIDDVSGLADTSQKFASFLTIARKFRCHCVYIFHTIHPEKSIWKSILSQTKF